MQLQLKQFQKSGRTRSVSRNRESVEREVTKEQEPVQKAVRTDSPEIQVSFCVNS